MPKKSSTKKNTDLLINKELEKERKRQIIQYADFPLLKDNDSIKVTNIYLIGVTLPYIYKDLNYYRPKEFPKSKNISMNKEVRPIIIESFNKYYRLDIKYWINCNRILDILFTIARYHNISTIYPLIITNIKNFFTDVNKWEKIIKELIPSTTILKKGGYII